MKNIEYGLNWKNKVQWLLLTVLMSLHVSTTWAQERIVKGSVVDELGVPVIAATVIVKGTTSMTITDMDGQFTLSVPDTTQMMEISYVGYETEYVKLTDKSVYSIQLRMANLALEEVVVIGYGIAKKEM